MRATSQLFQIFHFCLQKFQEPRGVVSVHLRVVKLHGDGEQVFDELLLVPSPHEEGVVVNARIEVDGTIDFRADDGGSPDDIVLLAKVVALARLLRAFGDGKVTFVEFRQILVERDIAILDAAVFQGHDDVDGELVELPELAVLGKQVELLDLRSDFPQKIAKEHVQLDSLAFAEFDDGGDIEGLDERDHGHRCVHPKLKRFGAFGFRGV